MVNNNSKRTGDFPMKTLEAEKLEEKLLSIQRVIVAVDLTEHSVATAHYAARIAKCFNASLYVAHVFAPETLYEFGSAGTDNLVDQRRRELSAQLDDLTEQVRKLVPTCESVLLEGEAAENISALARDVYADLIVTASHHPTFLGRLLNLDKAPQIMHRAPCPVLVYHEKNAYT
jgi:nucleotide-binding universal stress UspA family protein